VLPGWRPLNPFHSSTTPDLTQPGVDGYAEKVSDVLVQVNETICRYLVGGQDCHARG
jgi:hypothetical protein